jgi:hypothetical protein
MIDLRQAAQQALEALDSDNPDIQLRAAVTLRAAMELPVPEPVALHDAWSLREVYFDEDGEPSMHRSPPQRQWVGLTGLEQKALMAMTPRDAVFETEAKLKEKNHG